MTGPSLSTYSHHTSQKQCAGETRQSHRQAANLQRMDLRQQNCKTIWETLLSDDELLARIESDLTEGSPAWAALEEVRHRLQRSVFIEREYAIRLSDIQAAADEVSHHKRHLANLEAMLRSHWDSRLWVLFRTKAFLGRLFRKISAR